MKRITTLLACLTLLGAFTSVAQAKKPTFTLKAEATNFMETGDIQSVYDLCAKVEKNHRKHAKCFTFGTSPQGRPMMALAVNRKGVLSPKAASKKNMPVALFIAGIHSGEVAGKDAGYIAIRELLNDTKANALDDVVMLFVPMFSVDGYARFEENNRPNQVGPKKTGWRVNAQNLNLNRDWAKADTPEMRHMLGLIETWNPIVGVDLHTTNGAKFQHDIAIMVEPLWVAQTPMKQAGLTLKKDTMSYLANHGSMPIAFYPSFKVYDDPKSGVVDSVAPPRYSQGYFWMRNMLGMLVEAHSWKSYEQRVKSTENTIYAVLESTQKHAESWLDAQKQAKHINANLAGKTVVLEGRASEKTRMIDFHGYKYSRSKSAISGADMTRYDDTQKEVWRMPIQDDFQPSLTVTAPKAGYLVSAAYAQHIEAVLKAHHIQYRTLEQTAPNITVETYQDSTPKFGTSSYEGRHMLTLDGQWSSSTHDAEKGSLFIPINQPKAILIMELLEPNGRDSFASWGFFNTAFERKEYMEAYVAEEEAEKMLKADPELKKAFEEKLKDTDFAENPRARLDFFYQRHPAWDKAYGVYPVRRVHTAP